MKTIFAAAALALITLAPVQAQTRQQSAEGLIVRIKPGAEPARETPQAVRERARAVAGEVGVAVVGDRAIGARYQLLRLPAAQSGAELEATVRRLRLHPDVLDVEPDVRLRRLAVPNDPAYATQQWHLQAPTRDAAAINLPTAWDQSTGSTAGVVAVLDVGVRFDHPDLAGRLLPGYDFVSQATFANDGDGRDADASDPGDWVTFAETQTSAFRANSCVEEDSSWHGTFIAGQIAATTNNGVGVAGIDWQGKVLPVRIAGKCGALLSDILDGMRWAAGLAVASVPNNPTPARVLNLSFGGSEPCSAVYQDVVDEITAAGALLVVAGGNESGRPQRPADCAGVLSVGAVQQDGRKTWYSNYGPGLGLMAPGGGGTLSTAIYSLDNQSLTAPGVNTYGYKAGTSFSSPLAAGVAALMLAVNPSLTPAQLVTRLQASARAFPAVAGAPSCSVAGDVACNCDTATCGPGLLDGSAAVLAASPALAPTAAVAPVSGAVGGASVVLNGNGSRPSTGASIVGWQWTQLSGPPASIASPGAPQTSVTLPAGAARYVFRLTVTDSAGRRDVADLAVTATAAGGGGGGGGGDGGGTSGWWWGAGLWALALWAWRRRAVA